MLHRIVWRRSYGVVGYTITAFIANCPETVLVKKILKSVNIFQRYKDNYKAGSFLRHNIVAILIVLVIMHLSVIKKKN